MGIHTKLSSDNLKQSDPLEDVNIDGITKLVFEKGLRWEVGRDGAVGTASRYGLDGPGSNPGGGDIFRTRPNRTWGPPSLLHNMYRVFPGVERLGRGVNHPSPSSAEVKDSVQL
jgi:hypothetical protein